VNLSGLGAGKVKRLVVYRDPDHAWSDLGIADRAGALDRR
jgi:hypothetical protein